MTLIEASMCGLPIVARRDDSLVDLVEDDYNGYLVDTDQQIAERLLEILCDKGKSFRFSGNGLVLSDRFNIEIHVDKLESLYQHVMQKRSIQEW